MAHTFAYELERDNGRDDGVTEILVEFAVTSWGRPNQIAGPPEHCYLGDRMEIDILSATTEFGPFVLRHEEVDEIEAWAAENAMPHEPDPDWER